MVQLHRPFPKSLLLFLLLVMMPVVVLTMAVSDAQNAAVPADSPLPRGAREAAARAALAGAAQYICLAHALSPGKEVYRKSLAVVRTMLPLPFLRAGYLTAPRARSLGGVTETHRREWFVLDHVSLRRASSVEASLSTAGAGAANASGSAGQSLSASHTDTCAGGVAVCAPCLPTCLSDWLHTRLQACCPVASGA